MGLDKLYENNDEVKIEASLIAEGESERVEFLSVAEEEDVILVEIQKAKKGKGKKGSAQWTFEPKEVEQEK